MLGWLLRIAKQVVDIELPLRKNMKAAKPPKQSKGLGGDIGCNNKNSTWY